MAKSTIGRLKERVPRGLPEILSDAASFPAQSAAEERELMQRAKAGDKDAQERLLRANLGHIVRAVKRYAPIESPNFDDLFQEGYVGLCDASRKFDPTLGKPLKKFAQYHVHGRIKRALSNQARTIRLPVYQQAALRWVEEARNESKKKLEREPSRLEVAQDVGMSVEQIEELDRVATAPASLDAPIAGDDKDGPIDSHELIAGGRVDGDQVVWLPSPADLAEQKDVSRIVAEILRTLLPHEQELLRRRYGFYGNEETAPAAVAHRLGIRRSTLEKREAAALAKLREVLAGIGLGPETLRAFNHHGRKTVGKAA
jgi:RNA polymerase primary sigma factor